jgi:hypothetical protein
MKNTIKIKAIRRIAGIIALVAVIGFTVIACDGDSGGDPGPGPNPTPGSGQYSGKDVLSNSYSLSVGTNAASRAAIKGDRYSMDVKARDGKTRISKGTVTDISEDGTLTLKPDGDNAEEFTATVGATSLDSVAGVGGTIAQVALTDGSTLTTRTFDNIYLRAGRWTSNNDGPTRGENWGSGLGVLIKDFPANVSKLTKDNDRYTITVSGTIDEKLDHAAIEVQGLTDNDQWVWLAGSDEFEIPKGKFDKAIKLNVADLSTVSGNFMDYKEIIMQVTNVINIHFEDHPDWDRDYGTIPDDVPDGQIMASISDFNIKLKDTQKEALAGNMSDYTYGFQEDGLSVDYKQAVWSLSAENVANAKKTGAKFEFFMPNMGKDNNPKFEDFRPVLAFIWQDPVRELWWQDQSNVSFGDENDNWNFKMGDGVFWDEFRKKITVDLSTVIKDSKFAASTEINFIIAFWWKDGLVDNNDNLNVDELDIVGGNIVVPNAGNGGSMGYAYPGYESDGILFNYQLAMWPLSAESLSLAKDTGAVLEIVFDNDIESRSPGAPVLALIWQGVTSYDPWTFRGWSDGNDTVYGYNEDGSPQHAAGVSYDKASKKLLIPLSTALEAYNDFKNDVLADANLILACWWGTNDNIGELGIVSANLQNP